VDPDSDFVFDADPNPTFYSDADADADADPDPDPSFKKRFKALEKVLKYAHFIHLAWHLQIDADKDLISDPANKFWCGSGFLFDVDADPDAGPGYQNDADPDPRHWCRGHIAA
jgi:hypothetical protein